MPGRKDHFDLHQTLHLLELTLFLIYGSSFFGGRAPPLFSPITFYPSFIKFPVNYNKDCLLGCVYNFVFGFLRVEGCVCVRSVEVYFPRGTVGFPPLDRKSVV